MKVFRCTLTFVLGIVLGIVLLVLAIGGAVLAIGTSMTVGQLQSSLTDAEVIRPDSKLYGETLLEAIKGVWNDYQNFHELSLKVLYEHYGIALFNGVSGIDFTTKEDLYNTPLTEIIGNLSIVLDSFTLNDIGNLTGLDFASYNLPVLEENLDSGIPSAIDNIMKSFSGDGLTLRAIKDKFNIDLASGSDMIAALQDIPLNSFGSVIDALRISTFLNGDTDTYVPVGVNDLYLAAEQDSDDAYVEIPSDKLTSLDITPGAETYIAGGKTLADGSTGLDIRELRYIKKSIEKDGVTSYKYVVDNSCYAATEEAPTETYYRHMIYRRYDANIDNNRDAADLCVLAYSNSLASANADDIIDKGFISLETIVDPEGKSYADASHVAAIDRTSGTVNIDRVGYYTQEEALTESPKFGFEGTITKSSKLTEITDPTDGKYYFRTHVGTSQAVLQTINYMSISDLRNADGLLDNIKIKDVVSIDESSPKILSAIADCTLSNIGDRISELEVGDLFDVDGEDTSLIMKSLAKRGCKISELASVADKLTLGEIIEVNYDEYTAAPDGMYVRIPVYVKYNAYAPSHNPEPGSADFDYVKRYNKLDEGDYQQADDGEYVRVYYYTRDNEEDETQAEMQRYNLTQAADTAIAMQSIARRGCTIPELGTIMNELYISELMRIDADSAQIMQSLAKLNVKLDEFDEKIDELKISDVIEIGDNASKLMKTLKARKTKINELATVTDTLAIGDMIDIVYDDYTPNENGKYVKIVLANATDTEGEKCYYTLFNPANPDHVGKERYDRTPKDEASSKILQRFAATSLGDFSSAFGNLQVFDVMDIDADIYAAATGLQSRQEGESATNYYFVDEDGNEQRLFYYAEEDGLFRLASQDYINQHHDDNSLYYIKSAGTGNAVLRKLAYVNIDSMGPSLGKIIDDMLLSEIIDIYDAYAVEVEESFASESDPSEDSLYFVEWTEGDAKENGKEVIYLYDNLGKYTKTNERYVALDPESSELTNDRSEFYFVYKKVPTTPNDMVSIPSFGLDFNTDDLKARAAAGEYLAKNNIYYYDAKNDNMVFNPALCAYLAANVTKTQQEGNDAKLYYREVKSDASSVTEGKANNENTVFMGYKYKDGQNLYVDVLGKKTAYLSSNDTYISFWDLQMYRKETAENNSFIVVKEQLGDGVSTDGLVYSKHYAENVYIADANGEYVFINGEYVKYSNANPNHDGQMRFSLKKGYIATRNEIYYEKNGGFETELDTSKIRKVTNTVRAKSAAILRLLAGGTMKDLNTAVSNATMEQIIDITPDSMFDNPFIREATLNTMGVQLQKLLADMTMDDLIAWANVDGVPAEVRTALAGVKIPNFILSVEFKDSQGLVINMEKLYGYGN